MPIPKFDPYWLNQSFCSHEERKLPLEVEFSPRGSPSVIFQCDSYDLLDSPVKVFAKDFPEHQIASAIFLFSQWWLEDVNPRLNGYPGIDCVEWQIDRVEK